MNNLEHKDKSAERGAAIIELLGYALRRMLSASSEDALYARHFVETYIDDIMNGDNVKLHEFAEAICDCLNIVRDRYEWLCGKPEYMTTISRFTGLFCVASQNTKDFIGFMEENPEYYQMMIDELNDIRKAE